MATSQTGSTNGRTAVVIDRLTVKWVASLRETTHQLGAAEQAEEVLCSNRERGGAQTVGGRWWSTRDGIEVAAGKPMDPRRRINFRSELFLSRSRSCAF